MKRRIAPALLTLHRGINHSTADAWDLYAGHRARVTSLALAPGGRSLAILGAGNCNDVDLAELAACYPEIHLVDIDGAALQRARARQSPEIARSLALHAPVDVSGILARLTELRDRPPAPHQLMPLAQAGSAAVRAALRGTFDVVLSPCVLSQLMYTCEVALDVANPLLGATGFAVATAHLRALVQSIAPGGTGILVTDVSTSELAPLEDLFAAHEPIALLDHLEQSRSVLSGTSVSLLRKMLTADGVVGPLVAEPRIVPPWLWRAKPEMTLLAYAWVFRRRP